MAEVRGREVGGACVCGGEWIPSCWQRRSNGGDYKPAATFPTPESGHTWLWSMKVSSQ